MKTGAVEEISDHVKLMTSLQAIMEDHAVLAKESSSQSKKKADIEGKAGKELWDAAMMGLARSEGLIDVSQLEGASVREKQGQRKRARRPLSPSKHHNRARSSDDASSDIEPLPKRRRPNWLIHDVLQRRNDEDTARLQDARSHADRQHDELLHTQNQTRTSFSISPTKSKVSERTTVRAVMLGRHREPPNYLPRLSPKSFEVTAP
ncbi:hypothetical protein DFH08DRAFT_216293 [Mycena albidolilacea]|uniref:Uncharacterized protein n=1 Tax=Mycena albidolilacea TaxID=1033008 RepID=A0AAD7EQ55_9AGAR|nr:hypothetical protein DFH08DRAFT_216293 [Mycena albidolilacea]